MRANPAAARAWQLKFDRQIGAFRSIWQAAEHRACADAAAIKDWI
jgi:hypothetical protein